MKERHTYVFRTVEGWTRRVLAANSLNAALILSEEILAAPAASFHAYREEGGRVAGSRLLSEFNASEFIYCVEEN